MATYSGSQGNYSPESYTPVAIFGGDYSFNVTDGIYNIGDVLTLEQFFNGDPAGVFPTTLIGYTDSGWVGLNSGTYYYFYNGPVTAGQPIPVQTSGTFTTCFLAGTMIATPRGEVAVETLAIGDALLAADGRAVSVKWLGRQTVRNRFGLPEHRAPVLIEAGALGAGLPRRDLRVTADHALLLDGVLVQAGALVNGTTIRRLTYAELGQSFMVYHIETEAHEIVLAEGVSAETFVDNVTREGFDNYAEFVELYGTPAEPLRELTQPRVMSARQVPTALRSRIAQAKGENLDAAA